MPCERNIRPTQIYSIIFAWRCKGDDFKKVYPLAIKIKNIKGKDWKKYFLDNGVSQNDIDQF